MSKFLQGHIFSDIDSLQIIDENSTFHKAKNTEEIKRAFSFDRGLTDQILNTIIKHKIRPN